MDRFNPAHHQILFLMFKNYKEFLRIHSHEEEENHKQTVAGSAVIIIAIKKSSRKMYVRGRNWLTTQQLIHANMRCLPHDNIVQGLT